MKVDEATVRHIAKLARIRISDADAKTLEGELTGILEWVEQLEEVDTDGIEPMTSVVATQMKKRKDEVNDGGRAEDVVANAPERAGSFFVVPKVVE